VDYSYVDALQEKVKEYEAIATKARLVAGFNEGNGVILEQQPMQVVDQHQYYQSEHMITVEESLQSVCGEEDDEAVENEDDSPITDGMVQYTATSPQGPDDDGFFTESSNLHFAMSITTTVQRRRPYQERDGASRGSRDSPEKAKLQGSPSRTKASGYDMALRDFSEHHDNGDHFKQTLASPELQSLPLRHMAENLFDRYFRIANIVWPFLLEDVTRDRFNRMWMSSQPQNPVWMAQLNLIMSLGCQFYEDGPLGNESLPEAYDSGKQFYRRARGFIIPSMFTGNSIGMLQNLLLMVQYQQGTMRANQCWLTIGYAIRMAQGLGLHLVMPEDKSLHPVEVELRKRLWCGCFCLDRYVE
jgi:Fungal specific transcription factor domain